MTVTLEQFLSIIGHLNTAEILDKENAKRKAKVEQSEKYKKLNSEEEKRRYLHQCMADGAFIGFSAKPGKLIANFFPGDGSYFCYPVEVSPDDFKEAVRKANL